MISIRGILAYLTERRLPQRTMAFAPLHVPTDARPAFTPTLSPRRPDVDALRFRAIRSYLPSPLQ